MSKIKITTSLIKALTSGTYHDPASQIREVVSNSLDADAKDFYIISFEEGIAFIDNGNGLDIESLENDFLSIGYSDSEKSNSKIGRFGIGMLSIIPTCDEIYIYSKTKNTKDNLYSVINSKILFEEKNEKERIEDIFRIEILQKENAGSNEIFKNISKAINKLLPDSKSYTCLYLNNLKGEMKKLSLQENQQDNSFISYLIKYLQLILPLKFNDNDLFFNEINKSDSINKNELIKFYKDNIRSIGLHWYNFKENTFIPFVEDIFHRFFGDNDFNTYPIENFLFFKEEVVFESQKIIYGGYLILNSNVIKNDWREPLIRLNNVYICRLNEMDKEGDISRVYPKKNFIGGEIFIVGLKDCIKITRETFDTTSEKYKVFWSNFIDRLNPIIKNTNKKYEIKNAASKFFIKEQEELPNTVKTSIENAISIWKINDINEIEDKFKKIYKITPLILKKRENLEDVLIENIDKEVSIYEDENNISYSLIPKNEIKEPIIHNKIENGIEKYEIDINPNFFTNKKVNIDNLGDVEIITKKGNPDDPCFEIDISDKKEGYKVYINFFNSDIKGYNLSVFEVETILITAAADTGPSKTEFLEEAIKRLRKLHERKEDEKSKIIFELMKV